MLSTLPEPPIDMVGDHNHGNGNPGPPRASSQMQAQEVVEGDRMGGSMNADREDAEAEADASVNKGDFGHVLEMLTRTLKRKYDELERENVDHSAQIASLGRQATLHAQRETEIAQELKAAKDRVTELEGHLEQTRRERDEAKEAFKRSEERCVALEKAQAEEAARKIANPPSEAPCTSCQALRTKLNDLHSAHEALQQSRKDDHANWARMRQVLEGKISALERAKERASQRRAAKRKTESGADGDGEQKGRKRVKGEPDASTTALEITTQTQDENARELPQAPTVNRVRSDELRASASVVIAEETPPFLAPRHRRNRDEEIKPKRALGDSSQPNTPERKKFEEKKNKVVNSPVKLKELSRHRNADGQPAMAQTPRASTVGGRTLPHTDPRLFKTPTVISSAAVPTVSASTSRKTATAGGGGAGGGSTKPIRWLGRDAEVGQALDEPTSSSRGAHLASGPVGDGSPVLVVKRAMPREAGSKRALEKSKLGMVDPMERFEINPDRNGGVTHAYHEVVRKKDERRKLEGGDCEECRNWYEATKGIPMPGASMAFRPDDDSDSNVGDSHKCRHGTDEVQRHRNEVSRHKETFRRAATPPGYWDIGFPSSGKAEQLNRQADEQKAAKEARIRDEASKSDGLYRRRV